MLRLVTYNVRHASVEGVAGLVRVLSSLAPDVIALQEVDLGAHRSGGVDQPGALAGALGLHATFFPAFPFDGGAYGQLLLTREAPLRTELVRLPGPVEPPATADGIEPRVLGIATMADGRTFACAHLGLDPEERRRQGAAILAALLGRPRVVLLADLNEGPGGDAFGQLCRSLRDPLAGRAARATFPAHAPLLAADHVLLGPGLPAAVEARVVEAHASDHRPVLVVLPDEA